MTYISPNERSKDFIKNIKTYFNQADNTTLFEERNIIKIIPFEGKQYVVKSFKIPHLLNQVVYRFFRDSKAKRSYENAIKLYKMNINTPAPIGYVEFPSKFLFQESFYISEFFDYDFEIRAVLADDNFEDRERILREFVAFSYNLHQKGVFHVDYSPGNILIKKHQNHYIFSLIDVNRMEFIPFTDELRMKAFAKLSASDEDRALITETYSKLAKMDSDFAQEKMELFHGEHQKYIENKKRLRRFKKQG